MRNVRFTLQTPGLDEFNSARLVFQLVVLDGELEVYFDEKKTPVNAPSHMEGSKLVYTWTDLSFADQSFYVEGTQEGVWGVRNTEMQWWVLESFGTAVSHDTIKINIEKVVWPSNESGSGWQENPTTDWDGFALGDAWWIENSLSEIINGADSTIRTRYPEETSTDVWQGTGDYKDTVIDIPLDANGDPVDSFTITVEYDYDADTHNPSGYVDAEDKNRLTPGFFANSGIIIDGKAEIQIFDTGSLLNAIDNGTQVKIKNETPTLEPTVTGSAVKAEVGENSTVPAGYSVKTENVNALISGIPYAYVDTGPDPNYVNLQDLRDAHARDSGLMIIAVDRSNLTTEWH